MINEIIAFFAGWMLNWYALGGLVFFGLLFEHSELSGWSVFTGIITALVAFCFFQVSLAHILIGTFGYLLIGIIWSFWRYHRYVNKKMPIIKLDYPNTYMDHIAKLHPKNMVSLISSWIIIWPFSIIDNLIGDVISFVETLITTIFKNIYNKIYTSAVSSLVIKNG